MKLDLCPICRRLIPHGEACPRCAALPPPPAPNPPQTPSSPACSNCGAPLSKGAAHCGVCGAKQDPVLPAPPSAHATLASRLGPLAAWWARRKRWEQVATIWGTAVWAVGVGVVLFVILVGAQHTATNKVTDTVMPAWRAYVAVRSAVEVGVNYQRYGDLVRDFATEVNLLDSVKLTDKEREVAASLKKSLRAHDRALHIWRYSIESGRPVDDEALQDAWWDARRGASDATRIMEKETGY